MVESLYFHVPFCSKKCDYCHFFVLPNKDSFKKTYMDALEKEWQLVQSSIGDYKLKSIYFGGGTPYLIGPENIGKILSWIEHEECEVTLEANPELMTLETLTAFKEVGVNRLSVGIQSLDDTLLKTLSRTHSAEKATQAILLAKQAGFENISIDLMYDIPTQTLKQWKATLEKAVTLPITHISLYNLTIEPQTVFYKYREKLERQRPPEEESALMLEMAIETFEKSGFARYEISAFSKKGCPSIHNTGYWTDRSFYGLGPSAFSYFEGKRFRNSASLSKYSTALEKGELPIDFSEELDPKAKVREELILKLRLKEGLLEETLPLEEETKKEIEELIKQGLLQRSSGRLSLTEKGMLFYDTVAAELV